VRVSRLMNRLCTILLGMLCLISTGAQPPNIIYILTDEQRLESFGCYGAQEFLTPNIDDLAINGVVFDNAHYAVSICMPSRATSLTGRYLSSHQCGFVHPHNKALSHEEMKQTYPYQLKQAGYRTGFIGKFGVPVTEDGERGLRLDRKVEPYDEKKNLGETFDFFVGNMTHFGKNAKETTYWPEDDSTLASIYQEKNNVQLDRSVKTGDAMLHFLETNPKGKPFCLSVSFFAAKGTLGKSVYPEHYELFKDKTFTYPQNWVKGENGSLPKFIQENWRGVPLHKGMTGHDGGFQKTMRVFAAQGYTIDQQVGKLVAKLKEKEILENTVIIFTSDNGRFWGSRGLYDKALLYEESTRKPLVIFDGRLAKELRGKRINQLVSSVDDAVSILGMAGISAPDHMQGADYSCLMRENAPKEWQNTVFMENLFLSKLFTNTRNLKGGDEVINKEMIASGQSYRCRAVRTARYKYIRYYEQSPVYEELYDLKEDPQELVNLVPLEAYQAVLGQLRDRLAQMYAKVAKGEKPQAYFSE